MCWGPQRWQLDFVCCAAQNFEIFLLKSNSKTLYSVRFFFNLRWWWSTEQVKYAAQWELLKSARKTQLTVFCLSSSENFGIYDCKAVRNDCRLPRMFCIYESNTNGLIMTKLHRWRKRFSSFDVFFLHFTRRSCHPFAKKEKKMLECHFFDPKWTRQWSFWMTWIVKWKFQAPSSNSLQEDLYKDGKDGLVLTNVVTRVAWWSLGDKKKSRSKSSKASPVIGCQILNHES